MRINLKYELIGQLTNSSDAQPPINLMRLLAKLRVIKNYSPMLDSRADAFDRIRTYTIVVDL